jgi:hypothetical protein
MALLSILLSSLAGLVSVSRSLLDRGESIALYLPQFDVDVVLVITEPVAGGSYE